MISFAEALQILKETINKDHTTLNTDGDLNDQSVSYTENTADRKQYIESVAQHELRSYNDVPTGRMSRLIHRIRRVGDLSSGIYHPTLVPFEDKRIAGVMYKQHFWSVGTRILKYDMYLYFFLFNCNFWFFFCYGDGLGNLISIHSCTLIKWNVFFVF